MNSLENKKLILHLFLMLTFHFSITAQVHPPKLDVIQKKLETKNKKLEIKKLEDIENIELVFPTPNCPVTMRNPIFKWKSIQTKFDNALIRNEIILVEMNTNDSTMDDFNKRKVIFTLKDIKGDSLNYPKDGPNLEMKKLYGWQIKQYIKNKLLYSSNPMPFYIIDYKLPFNINEVSCCNNNIITNGTFENGLTEGILGQRGIVDNWDLGYGKPEIIASDEGCGSRGYIRLKGSKKTGACIVQDLQSPKIKQGKKYRFSACIRLSNKNQITNYAYIKVIAYNGNLPSSIQHPVPSSTIATMGWSGKIMQKDWITFSLDAWTAPKDFDKIGIYCFSDSDDVMSVCELDKICLTETKEVRSCGDYTYNEDGQPEIDASVMSNAQNQVTTYYEENRGKLIDLYQYEKYDGTTSFYQLNDDCASIGGQIPDANMKFNADEALKELGFNGGTEELEKILKTQYTDTSKKTKLKPISPISNTECKISYNPNQNLPFSGRDIIFVHGLKLEHLCARASKNSGAIKNWPTDKSEFYSGGYYNKVAVDGWKDHIQEWLRSRGHNNRFLIVSYNCSQRADVGAHAILTQIRDAMDTGEGVDFIKEDPRGRRCFGRDAVIISHSTGAIVVDIAMSIAEKSKHNATIQKRFGNIGFIPNNMKLHVALHGAFNGSSLASLYIAAQNVTGLSSLTNHFVCKDISGNPYNTKAIALQSILIDLQPSIANTLWRPFVSSTPVATITVAGGHAHGTYELPATINIPMHPGFDDGVLTMGCQSANPFIETSGTPVGFIRHSWLPRLYDMGTAKANSSRANKYFLNQTYGTLFSPFVAGASTAFLSPTGMVQPVLSIPPISNPENRITNHYSFLQTASDHYKGPRGKKEGSPLSHNGEGYDPNNHNTTSGFRYLNYDYSDDSGRHWEESLVITDPVVYSKGYINPSIKSLPQETIKGEYLDFDVYGPQFSFKCCPKPKFKFWWGPMFHVKFTIWERKYHLMSDSDTECEAGYVYKYVLR